MKVEISLKEIMVYILRRWKAVIVFASVLAILVGGYSYFIQMPQTNDEVVVAPLNQTTKLSLSIDLIDFIATSSDSYHITLARNDLLGKVYDRYSLIAQGARWDEVLSGNIPSGLSEDKLRDSIKIESPTSGIINILVTGSDGIDSDKAADAIYAYLTSYTEAVSKSVSNHTLAFIAKTSIEDVMQTVSVKNNPAYISVLIAFISGIIFATIYSAIVYLVKLPIQIPEQIQQRLGIRYIGGVQHKKVFSLADRLAGSLRIVSVNEGAMDMIYANLNNFIGDNKNILITGSITEHLLYDFLEKISLVNKKAEVTFIAATDINKSASSINALANCDAVLLVESIDQSKLKHIKDEKDLIEMSHKEILGYVLY